MKDKTDTTSLSLSKMAIEGLLEVKGLDIVRLELKKIPGAVTDYFVIATGSSDRHVMALANSVIDVVREQGHEKPRSTEGMQLGEWILLDYVNVVVHVFQESRRNFFNLEELWGDAKKEVFADE